MPKIDDDGSRITPQALVEIRDNYMGPYLAGLSGLGLTHADIAAVLIKQAYSLAVAAGATQGDFLWVLREALTEAGFDPEEIGHVAH